VLNRFSLISFAVALSLGAIQSMTLPVRGQALVPHVLRLDGEQLEQQGLILVQEAAQLAQFQQYELALVRAQLASQLVPDNPQAWALLGSLYLQTEQYSPAIQTLLKAKSLDSKNSAVLFALGSAYFQQENYPASVQYFTAGLKQKPDMPGALFGLGNAYYKLKQYDEAIRQHEKAVKIDEKFWPAVNNIGLIRYEQGDTEAAITQWRQAVAIDANQPEPKLALAIALYAKGMNAEGLEMGEAALKLDNRYADAEFLTKNLWGERLVGEAQKFLALPQIRAALSKINSESLPR
jgi:tetratricopeptide (TPR) repeat protein